MKDSIFPLTNIINNNNKKPKCIIKYAQIHLQNDAVPLISPATGSPIYSIRLELGRPYTIGRAKTCDFVFADRRVSQRHCQLIFDYFDRKIFIVDGDFLLNNDSNCVVSEFMRRVNFCDELKGNYRVRVSLNGVFVNGIRVNRGEAKELRAGDEVSLVCGNEGKCGSWVHIGFVILGLVFKEEVVMGSSEIQLERPRFWEVANSSGHSQGSVSGGKRSKRVFATCGDEIVGKRKRGGVVGRAKFLLSTCREILRSDDPVSYIMRRDLSDCGIEIACASKFSVGGEVELSCDVVVSRKEAQVCQISHLGLDIQHSKEKSNTGCINIGCLLEKDIDRFHSEDDIGNNNSKTPSLNDVGRENALSCGGVDHMKTWDNYHLSPGKNFYLNRLRFMDHDPFNRENCISLPELLCPIESISRVFIATFTSDILWFLSYCEIPCHLPVTIACHNTERCWDASPEQRTSVPYSDFPNLVVVFPSFPEEIAFGKDRKRQGIACHHPKLIVLQREDSIRVIISSANLVSNQILIEEFGFWFLKSVSSGVLYMASM